MPAGSISSKRVPWIQTSARTGSRVVPGSALTRARFSPTSALKRVDFPALVGPYSSTEGRSAAPGRIPEPSIRAASCASTRASCVCACSTRPSPRSLSVKSSEASRVAETVSSPSASACSSAEKAPLTPERAALASDSLRERISAMIDSACTRSIRPFSNARRVNSPGPASSAPSPSSDSSRRCTSNGLPGRCSSISASPVKERPAAMR